jgi:hypothetical protein
MAKHELDEDDRGRVRSGTLPALIERLTLEIPTDPTSKAVSNIPCTRLIVFQRCQTANHSPIFFS